MKTIRKNAGKEQEMPKAYYESKTSLIPFEHITFVSKDSQSILTIESSDAYFIKESDFPEFIKAYRDWLDSKETKPVFKTLEGGVF